VSTTCPQTRPATGFPQVGRRLLLHDVQVVLHLAAVAHSPALFPGVTLGCAYTRRRSRCVPRHPTTSMTRVSTTCPQSPATQVVDTGCIRNTWHPPRLQLSSFQSVLTRSILDRRMTSTMIAADQPSGRGHARISPCVVEPLAVDLLDLERRKQRLCRSVVQTRPGASRRLA
jgi:hypothetical protein